MLNDHERDTLDEIEREFAAGEPDTARTLADAFDRGPRLWPYTVTIALGAVVTIIGIVLALPSIVLLATVPTLAAAGARWRACKRWHESTS